MVTWGLGVTFPNRINFSAGHWLSSVAATWGDCAASGWSLDGAAWLER